MSVIPGKICKRALCVHTAINFFFRFKQYKLRPIKNSDFLLQERGCVTVSVKKCFY